MSSGGGAPKCDANCGRFAVTGRNGRCTQCPPAPSASHSPAAKARTRHSAADRLAKAAAEAGHLVNKPDGLDGSTSPNLPADVRDRLAAALEADTARLIALRQEEAELTRRMEATILDARLQNRQAWTRTTTTLTPGTVIAIDTPTNLGIVSSVRSDGEVSYDDAVFRPNDGTPAVRLRTAAFHRVVAPDQAAVDACNTRLAADRAAWEALEAQPCPKAACPKCGHTYCGSYHYAARSDLGGWEAVCVDRSCTCVKCVRVRRHNHTADSIECCRCNPPGRDCECRTCNGRS